MNTLISEAVQAELEAMSSRKRALRETRFRAIEQARLERIVTEWLEIERQRQLFTVLQKEQEREIHVGGLDLVVRADRVDRLEDRTLVVVDYKSGEYRPSEWEGPRPDQPQLPLYAVTARVAVSGVFFGVLKRGKSGFRGLAAAEGIVPGVKLRPKDIPLDDTIEEWRGVLENLGRDFRDGRAAVDPKSRPKTCRHCSLPALCRIHEDLHEYDDPDGGVADV